VSKIEVKSELRQAGLIGQLEVSFQGNDPKAKMGYFLFSDFTAASDFNRKYLPPMIPGQKLLAYPPMARCADVPNIGGYCDMWIQDDSVILSTVASQMDVASALIAAGFKQWSAIHNRIASQPPPPVKPGGLDACSLITIDEAQSALHQQTQRPEADRVGGCNWRTNSGDDITVQLPGTGRQGFDASKAHTSGTTPLPGIGDDAFFFASLAGFIQIDFIRNGHYAVLIYQCERDPDKLGTAKTLAAKIASRL
jgi:hypothetical protein